MLCRTGRSRSFGLSLRVVQVGRGLAKILVILLAKGWNVQFIVAVVSGRLFEAYLGARFVPTTATTTAARAVARFLAFAPRAAFGRVGIAAAPGVFAGGPAVPGGLLFLAKHQIVAAHFFILARRLLGAFQMRFRCR